MVNVDATIGTSTTGSTGTTNRSLAALEPGDFMNILVKQLQYQDPFEPMDNDQMLAQISQIRNMEMSMTLTDSLKTLTDQQRLTSATTMIGQYVTGTVKDADGKELSVNGVVRAVRFDGKGQPILDLDNGNSLPLKSLTNVTDLNRFIGKYVEGTVTDANNNSATAKGVVTAIRYSESGEAFLELQDGTVMSVAGLQRVTDVAIQQQTAASQLTAKAKQPAVVNPLLAQARVKW